MGNPTFLSPPPLPAVSHHLLPSLLQWQATQSGPPTVYSQQSSQSDLFRTHTNHSTSLLGISNRFLAQNTMQTPHHVHKASVRSPPPSTASSPTAPSPSCPLGNNTGLLALPQSRQDHACFMNLVVLDFPECSFFGSSRAELHHVFQASDVPSPSGFARPLRPLHLQLEPPSPHSSRPEIPLSTRCSVPCPPGTGATDTGFQCLAQGKCLITIC